MTELATGAATVLVLLARELWSRGAAFFLRFVLFSSFHRNPGLGHQGRIDDPTVQPSRVLPFSALSSSCF
jgi:hypothetical protein